MTLNPPPFIPDSTKLYRVWFTQIKDGLSVQQKVVGRIEFRPDGDGWGLFVEQPGDTSLYLPPGKYDRVQESQKNVLSYDEALRASEVG